MLPATLALRILEKYLWRKGNLIISQREHSYIYFSWILTSSEPNEMAWVTTASIQVTALLERCSFFVIYKLCYFMSLTLHKMDVCKLRRCSFERLFSNFEKLKKLDFFSSLTASIQSETCSSLNLRKVFPLINSYLLNIMIFI